MRAAILPRLFGKSFGSVSASRPDVWVPYLFTDIDKALESIT
jgi:hypothetical protein